MTKLPVDTVVAAIERAAPTSKVGRWFALNRAEFAARIEGMRVHWSDVAGEFAKAGLLDVPAHFHDDTPEGEAARKAAGQAIRQIWYRVRKRPAAPSPSPTPKVAPPPAQPRQPARPAGGDVANPYGIAPATWKKTDKE
jgi:hypothetical protein